MNPALANAPLFALLPDWLAAANDDVEGIEVTYLEVEEIELEASAVPSATIAGAWNTTN